MIDGIKIKLGEDEFMAPALNLKAMRRLLPKITALKTSGLPSDEDFATIIDIVHSALLRNYPNITPEMVEDGLDMGNMQMVVAQVLGQSGLQQGKVVAAMIPESSTGEDSTGTSSLPPDGPMTT